MENSPPANHLVSHGSPRPAWSAGVEKILVPLDGSRLAECVLPHAVATARLFDAELILLRVLELRQGHSLVDGVACRLGRAEMRGYLEETAAKLEALGVRVSTRLAEGRSAQEIVAVASQTECDLIVLSSHGRSGLAPFHLGSTVQKVIETAGTSVFVVRARFEEPDQDWQSKTYPRILVAVDGSPRSDWALCLARCLAEKVGGELVALQVVPVPEMSRHFPAGEAEASLRQEMIERNRQAALENLVAARGRLGEMAKSTRTRVEVSEHVAPAINTVCDEEDASLVVLNAHGFGCDSKSQRYGGIAEALLRYGRHPTLVFQDLTVPDLASPEVACSRSV